MFLLHVKKSGRALSYGLLGASVLCLGLLAAPATSRASDTVPSSLEIPPPFEPLPDSREASFLPPPTRLTPKGADVSSTGAQASGQGAVALPSPDSAAPVAEPWRKVDLGQPVSSQELAAIDPESAGLLTPETGGLPDNLWKDTPRALVDQLMPAWTLPSDSPTINGLARRLLLSSAGLPQGPSGAKGASFLDTRLDKLVALGDVESAWKLLTQVRPEKVGDASMRPIVEAALIGPESKEICAKVPAFIAAHGKGMALAPKDEAAGKEIAKKDDKDKPAPDPAGVEWQKALMVCQLRDGDVSAVQLSLDLLREQKVKDDTFLSLLSLNAINKVKQLPRQLTPLGPLSLAVLRQTDLPLPPELFARPEAMLVPELLKAKTTDEKARLGLALRWAKKGLLGSEALKAALLKTAFSPEELADATHSSETGAVGIALLVQAAVAEQNPARRTELLGKLLALSDRAALSGDLGRLLADLLASVPAITDRNLFAAEGARIMAMASRPDQALAWLKLAQGTASRLPDVASALKMDWPLDVLSGLLGDQDYGQGLAPWMESVLATEPGNLALAHAATRKVAAILALFSASGYAVPEAAALRVMETDAPLRRAALPSPLLLERLRRAGEEGRQGEVALLSVLLMGGGVEETPLIVTVDVVRALRHAEMKAEALGLAREAAAFVMDGAGS